jgi:hypothetical protein
MEAFFMPWHFSLIYDFSDEVPQVRVAQHAFSQLIQYYHEILMKKKTGPCKIPKIANLPILITFGLAVNITPKTPHAKNWLNPLVQKKVMTH